MDGTSIMMTDAATQREAPLSWIDTHVHMDASEFDSDREQVLLRARQSGVTYCLNPSVSAASFAPVHALAATSQTRSDWPRLLPAFGIHPLHVAQAGVDDLLLLEKQITAHRPVAIGEIGLDGYPGTPDLAQQRPLFETQLALAAAHGLPVLLHVRHAVEAVIQTLKRIQGSRQKIPGGIAHAFNGSESQAAQLTRMGFLLGFGGSLTYEGSTRIRRLAKSLPLNHIVLETDAPDMPPAWLHQGRNEPASLPRIAQTLAALRDIAPRVVSAQTSANVRALITDYV